MAAAKTARLVGRTMLSDDVALLRFAADEPFAFVGGQYIIVSTGIPLGDPAEGKTVKRAYSILSADRDEGSFEVALRRIGDGPGSNYMLGLGEGSALQFSGPWGKYLPPIDTATESAADATTAIIATDTGITVALGLLRGQTFQRRLPQTRVHWLVSSEQYFVSEEFVRQRLPTGCGSFERITVPVERAAREQWFASEQNRLVSDVLRRNPTSIYLSGDGFLLAALRDAIRDVTHEATQHTTEDAILHAAVITGEEAAREATQQPRNQPPALLVESFFHHQELKKVEPGIARTT